MKTLDDIISQKQQMMHEIRKLTEENNFLKQDKEVLQYEVGSLKRELAEAEEAKRIAEHCESMTLKKVNELEEQLEKQTDTIDYTIATLTRSYMGSSNATGDKVKLLDFITNNHNFIHAVGVNIRTKKLITVSIDELTFSIEE